jgi:hypothetical protein
LCYGHDGHVATEKLSDCDECSNIDLDSFTEFNTNIYFDYDDCEDFPIMNSCFEDNEFVLGKRENVRINLIANLKYIPKPEPKIKHLRTTNQTILKDSILENYSTISLLI